MANFESGVASYVKAYAVVNVYFPVDDKGRQEIACKHCPYLSSNERMCQLNKEPVAYPNKFVGDYCPLCPIENKGVD
jgi:hypothetical protein